MNARWRNNTLAGAIAVMTAVAGFGVARALETPPHLLGEIDFPNSGSAEAQPAFLEGVLYLHNFEYQEAADAFKRAQAIDPDFALAYWGEAMTYNHPLWSQQARKEAEDVLRELGRTPEARAAKAPTQREKDYLHAIEILYGTVRETRGLPKLQRDIAYMETMRRLHETYPEDHEAATFYGLSLLGTVHEGRDFGVYMHAAAELMSVWDENRKHPGAAHYLIHSFDDPVHARLGLPMARAYSAIAPAAAHAQHMTSHIFVALGMWDDLVKANERAVEIEFAATDDAEDRPLTASHYVYWLEYGYLQQGRVTRAEDLLKVARARLENNPRQQEKAYYGTMYARFLLDSEKWHLAESLAAPDDMTIGTPYYHFARAAAAIELGDLDAARDHMRYVTNPEGGYQEVTADEETVEVLRTELEALFAKADGDEDRAVELARQAVEKAVVVPFNFGPPKVAKPAAELLGDILFDFGRYEEAVAAYKDQLTRTPLRTGTLLGLARASQAAGDEAASAEAYRLLAEIWHDAEKNVPGYAEAFKVSKNP